MKEEKKEFKYNTKIKDDVEIHLITNRMGRKYWVEKEDKLYEQRFARENGPYQVRNLKFIRFLYPNNPIIVDIGMNVGNNTMEYGTWAKKVYGFEPFKRTFELAEENIKLNKTLKLEGQYFNSKKNIYEHNKLKKDGWWKQDEKYASLDIVADIEIFNIGLGNTEKDLFMEHHDKNAGHNCVLSEKRKHITKNKLFKVKMNKLDNYNFGKIDAIKIDVEGFEYEVVKGSKNIIKKYRPTFQLEMVENQFKRFNATPEDIVNFFINNDYIFCMFNGTNLGKKWKKVKKVMDYFFVPKELFNKKLNIQKTLSDIQ